MSAAQPLMQQFYEMLLESQFWPRQQLVDYQRSQLEQLLRHARANVPFYESRLDPVFRALSPGRGDIPATPGRENAAGTAEEGYLHCGPNGAGHFVKMIHNGIEYGLMAAYAEGFNILKSANLGAATHEVDAETTPLAHPEHYRYDFDLPAIAELWRRGSVIPSWLLDLTAQALAGDPELEKYGGRVSDSGEGRWTVAAANDLGVPAFVLAAALFGRFASRGNATFQNQVQSAMRFGFGGHQEKPPAAAEKPPAVSEKPPAAAEKPATSQPIAQVPEASS